MTGLINRIKRITAIGLIAVLMSQSFPMTAYGEGQGNGDPAGGPQTMTGVTYMDESGNEQTRSSYTILSGNETALDPGWCVVSENIVFNSSLILNGAGEYYIILSDGSTMTIAGEYDNTSGTWIAYNNSNSPVTLGCLYDNDTQNSIKLSIYGQAAGSGKLNIYNNSESAANRTAMVGDAINVGKLTINGGMISCTAGGANSYGINTDKFTINDGTLTATATADNGNAIYCDNNNSCFTVNGGSITAVAQKDSGSGIKASSVTINGGEVYAEAKGSDPSDDNFGIMSGGIIRINGGRVTAKGTHAGIYSQYNGDDGSALLLSWKNETNFVSANSILLNSNQNVVIEPGKNFIDGDGHYYVAANTSEVKNLTDFTLQATSDMPQVTFDSNGGAAVEPQTVDSDLHAARPVTPIKQGYTFNGWYRNSDLSGEAFDFSTETVNTDLTLYAKWAQVAEISYIGSDEEEISGFKTYIPLEADYTALPAENYYVGKNITLPGRIKVTGEVNLILGDGFTLTASKGISVTGEDNTLNIFCESGKTGTLTASAESGNAAIGGDSSGDNLSGSSGNINIYGGSIQAQGGDYAAAIGGGMNNENYGTIRIYGGTVSASGGKGAAAIGGGQINGSYNTTRPTDGTIGIYGGKVSVNANEEGTGIGGGKNSYGGDINILGGQVTVTVSPNNPELLPYPGIGDGYLYEGTEKAQITLGCGNSSDNIKSANYNGNVRVAPYQTIQIEDTSEQLYGEIPDPNAKIKNKTLIHSHTHVFDFSSNGSTIIAKCQDQACELHDNPATLTLSAPSENDIVYDSLKHPVIVTDDRGINGYSPVYYEKKNGSSWDDKVTAAPEDVGTYRASITLEDVRSHSTATVSVEYTIAKRDVTITGLTASNKIYDDTTTASADETAMELHNLIEGDAVSIVSGNAAFADADASNNKTVTFTGYSLTGEAAGNYNLVSQPESVTADIGKRPVTIKANDQSVQMGDAIDETAVTLDQDTGRDILTDKGHELTVLTLTPDPDPRSVVSIPPNSNPDEVPVPGTITGSITPSGAVIKRGEADVTGNYDITYQNGSLEITWRKAKVTKPPTAGIDLKYAGCRNDQWLLAFPGEADTKMEYNIQQISRGNGELLKNPDGSLVRDNKPPTDSYGDDFSAWEAGTYHVWYRAAMLADDIMPSEPGCITVSIDTVPLTVKVPDTSISYGEVFPDLTPVVNGFVSPEEHAHIGSTKLEYQINDEWKNVEDSAVQGTCPDPGTYPVRVSYTGNGEVTSCYDITSIPGTLTVEPRTVGLIWGNTQFTYDGNPHVPTVTLSNLANNDTSETVTVNVTGEQVNAGENYTASAVSLSGSKAAKYRLPSDNTKTFSIAKKNYTESITNVGVSVPISATSFTASVAGKMPTDAGALTYSLGTILFDGSSIAEGDFSAYVDDNGLLTVTINKPQNDLKDKTLDVNVKVNSTNYNEKTIKLEATFISKADAGVSIGSGNSQSVKSLSVDYFDYKDTELSLNAEVADPSTEGTWTWGSSNPEVATVTGSDGDCNVTITGVGTTIITAKYESGTTAGSATLVLTVNPVSVEIPQAISGLSYVGTQLTGVVEDNTYYTVTGGSGTDPGDYVATVTLNDIAKYRWTDGTKVVKYIPWRIEKAAGPGAPTGLLGVAPTTADNIDGKITGVSDSMEYSTNNNFGQAIRCMGTDILGLTPGTYYVRVRETATTKAGAATAVPVEPCSAPAVRAIQGLVYNGSSQILVETDKTSNGKIYYAVVKKGDPEPAEGQYSTSTATAKDAGSYYVWYKASRNDNASYVEVTIRKKNATVMLSAEDKFYDGTTAAKLKITVDGVCRGDSIVITGVSGKFADKNVGGAKNVSIDSSKKVISGAENYVLSDIPASVIADINIRSLDDNDVKILAIPVQYYTGSEVCPKPVVKCLGVTLEEGEFKDYTLSYKNNTGKGTASVTVTGKNNCEGSITRNFEIGLPAFGSVTVAQPVDKDFGTALGTTPAVTAKDVADQNIDLTSGTETVTVYYSSTSTGTGIVWDSEKMDLNAGTYYVWATVAEKAGDGGHAAAKSGIVSFKIKKIPYEVPDSSILPAQQEAGYDVTVALPDGAKNTDYEYVITVSSANEPAADANGWSVLPVLTHGKFTAAGLNANSSYKIWLRRKADANHTASTAISRTFATPEKVMLSYDLNGGSGTVPEPKSYASGTFVAIDDGAKVSRYGYSFDGWWDAKEGGTKAEGNLQITESRVLYAHWLANQYFVSYDANGGRGSMADQIFSYDMALDLRQNTFSRSGYIFAGWATSAGGEVVYTDRQNVKNLASKGTVTLYAVWVVESWSVSGEVKEGEDETNSTPAQGISVTLKRGDTGFGSVQSTGLDGRYSFSGVPAGIYNLVATRNLGNGKTQTVTTLVEVSSGNVDVGAIVIPDKNVSSEIDVKADTPVVMVGGLDAVAVENAEDGKEVNVTMTVETKSEAQAEGSEEIRQLAEESSEDGSKVEIDFLDISIGKTVGEQTIAEPVTETGNVIELIIPFNFTGKRNCQMLRFHEGEAMAFRKLASRPQNPEDGTCFEDYENSRLFSYSKLFSTFAISYESSAGYMITFRKNDGTGDQYIQDITADAATSVTLTANTFNRSGYSFSGWNTEANGEGTSYTDGQSVELTSDLVLYAQWTQNSGGGGGGGTTPVPATYTVSFNMNGKEAANAPEMQQIEEGKWAIEPVDTPTAEGFKFDGWYMEAECVNTFDFNSPITADTVVYAKWIDEEAETFTVAFDLNGKTGTTPAEQTVEKDKTATEPTAPSSEGYTFTGWYTKADCKTKYDFATPVTTDITLYAGWEAKSEPEPIIIVDDDDWNLYEDASVHEFKIRGISVDGTVANSNAKSKAYYDAKISGSTITVSVTGDRKKASEAANATLEFDLGSSGVVEYTLPVSYVKPSFKLSSTTATIKSGSETVLKTTLLVKNSDGSFVPYDMDDVKVSGTGLGTVTKTEDGNIEIRTSAAGKGQISIVKDAWDGATPVSLTYTVKGSKKDVLNVDLQGLKIVVVNSNAKGQVFRYDITLNGAAPAEGDIQIVDKKNTGLATIGEDGKLTIAYKDGVKNGTYTITLQAGEAKTNVKVKVSGKALDKAITAKIQTKYDVVTKQAMVVIPNLKDVSGTIETVAVAESGFSAKLNAAGNIVIDYTGDAYNVKNLNIGTLTLSIRISGIDEPVKLTLNKVKAKKTTPKAKVGTITIPAGTEAADGKIIATANIVSTYKVSSGKYMTIRPISAEIVGTPKNVSAKVNENDVTEIDIYSISKKNASFKVKITYAGGVTKTVTVKVKK